MQKLITSNGKEFPVRWCGVSTVDLSLRFAVVESSIQEVLATFMNTEETALIKHLFDSLETVYEGYTVFKGVEVQYNGDIVVAMNHE